MSDQQFLEAVDRMVMRLSSARVACSRLRVELRFVGPPAASADAEELQASVEDLVRSLPTVPDLTAATSVSDLRTMAISHIADEMKHLAAHAPALRCKDLPEFGALDEVERQLDLAIDVAVRLRQQIVGGRVSDGPQ